MALNLVLKAGAYIQKAKSGRRRIQAHSELPTCKQQTTTEAERRKCL